MDRGFGALVIVIIHVKVPYARLEILDIVLVFFQMEEIEAVKQ